MLAAPNVGAIETYTMYKHILLPTDGSDRSRRAIAAGVELAQALNAKVTGLYVRESTYIPGADDDIGPRAEEALSIVAQLAKEAGVSSACTSILGDQVPEAIIKFCAENGCDLIIMGIHARSRIGKFILGSVAASVLGDSRVPVLLHR